MFGFHFGWRKLILEVEKIDFDLFGCSQVELILTKLGYVAFYSKRDFYTQIYYSSHF